jgi:L-ascorbate metabolism protein UlaG (beta-lactamase superfamily)
MKITYFWHSAVLLEWEKTILIDPFISWNPLNNIDINTINPDYILVTHWHKDHIWNTIEIAKNSGAIIIAIVELANYFKWLWLKTIWFNVWWELELESLKIKMTEAIHSSSLKNWGNAWIAIWFLIFIENKYFYHAGDTGLFYNMKEVISKNNIDIAFLPIWWYYTMWVDDAVIATSRLGCKNVIPIHYNTFPSIKADPLNFKKKVENETNAKCNIMNIWESLEF